VPLLELVAPGRLGHPFRWLLGSVVVANTGDGIMLAAGPLLVASLTRDPLLVALAVFLQQLPWLLFGLVAGAYVDRVDRRLVVAGVDALRGLVLLVLALVVLTDVVTIGVVLGTLFVLGTAETFSDIASQTLLISMVEREDLGIANARLRGGFIVANQLVGPPLGAFLFAVATPAPFAAAAACFLLGSVLVSRIALRPHAVEERRPVHVEVVEGIRWLWHHAAMRTLAITIVLFNVTYGAAWGVLVLYASERLGLSAAGYGWLTTSAAVGGIVGTTAYGWLERTFGMDWLMRIGLVIETLTHLAFALTTSAAVAFTMMFVFGAHAFVWGTTAQTIRQLAVPVALQGRVGSVYMIGVVGGMLIGTPIGGALARAYGITAPFWFGFVGSAVLVVVLWRQLGHLTRDVTEQGVDDAAADPA
jgi:MFS family permease